MDAPSASGLQGSSPAIPPEPSARGITVTAQTSGSLDNSLTEHQRAAASARRLELISLLPLLESGASLPAACKTTSTPLVRTWRILAKAPSVLRRPVDRVRWLLEQPTETLAPDVSTGRPSVWAPLASTPAVQERLQTLYLATIGASSEYMAAGERTGSLRLALERFADSDLCPAQLARALRHGATPRPLVDVIRRITPDIEARLRGSRHATHAGPTARRAMTYIDSAGHEHPLRPGDLWELDDMSTNFPFWSDTPDGVILSRQGLYCRDVATGRWMGVDLVARPREAYRAEDILRFLRRLMQLHGKPAIGLRLERGVWAARSLRGLRIDDATGLREEEFERPAAPDGTEALVQDGLRALGIRVLYTYSSRGKGGIESAFNYLQDVQATFCTDLVNIGRHPGEFEIAAARLRQTRADVHHPRDLGFGHIDTLAERLDQAMSWINRKQDPEAWSDIKLQALTAADMAVFLPDMRDLEIRHGRVTAQLDGRPYDFAAEWFAELGAGYRVTLRWDPTEPTLGAAIYNRETSSANHGHWQDGQWMGWAEYQAEVPNFDLSGRDGSPSRPEDDVRRRQQAWVRTAFRGLPKPGRPTVKIAAARDGRGQVTELTSDPVGTHRRGVRLPSNARRSVNVEPDFTDAITVGTPRRGVRLESDCFEQVGTPRRGVRLESDCFEQVGTPRRGVLVPSNDPEPEEIDRI